MKKALAVMLATVLIGVCTNAALAQVKFIQVYFDADYNDTQTNCGLPGSTVSLYVAALNLNMNVQAVDYRLQIPPSLMYVGENVNAGPGDPVIGNSEIGIAIAYNLPQNGFQTMLLSRVFAEWTGECDCGQGPQPLRVVGYDVNLNPSPLVVRWPDSVQFEAVGMLSLICPGATATEATTWGGVKALYR